MMMKVKTYNHLLDIGFEVPDSLFKNADDCLRSERNKVIRAILRRLEAIMQEDDRSSLTETLAVT